MMVSVTDIYIFYHYSSIVSRTHRWEFIIQKTEAKHRIMELSDALICSVLDAWNKTTWRWIIKEGNEQQKEQQPKV